MDVLDRPLGDLKKANFTFQIERHTGKDVLDVADLSVKFDEVRTLFHHVSFQLQRSETVALIGPNGIGKSTLLKVLVGQRKPTTGTVRWGSNVKLGYYDQEQTGLTPSNTVLEELWSEYPNLEEARIRTVLGSFLFSGEDVLKRISSLSGGEKARVSLAKLMLLQANVLILDEPTNHLDLFSKEVLEAALLDFEGTLLFISHDRYFLNKMAERIVELSPNGTEHFLGNYDDMIEKKAELEEIRREAEAKLSASSNKQQTAAPTSYEIDKQAKRDERSRQRKLEQTEQTISELEEQIAELEVQLTDPSIFNDYMRIQEIQAQIDKHRTALATAYEEWEQLSE